MLAIANKRVYIVFNESKSMKLSQFSDSNKRVYTLGNI